MFQPRGMVATDRTTARLKPTLSARSVALEARSGVTLSKSRRPLPQKPPRQSQTARYPLLLYQEAHEKGDWRRAETPPVGRVEGNVEWGAVEDSGEWSGLCAPLGLTLPAAT